MCRRVELGVIWSENTFRHMTQEDLEGALYVFPWIHLQPCSFLVGVGQWGATAGLGGGRSRKSGYLFLRVLPFGVTVG